MSNKVQTELEEQKRRLLADIEQLESEDPSKDTFRDINNTDDEDAAESEAFNLIQARLDTARDQLQLIEKALAKLQNGSYGTCERCGKPIPEARLEAKPWAIYDVECEEIVESGRQ